MNMIKKPKVSIIVPVYNTELFLKRSVGSILSQTFTDLECILINDFSTDNSPQICDDFAKQDSRIKVIHKMKNEGNSLARKAGFDNSLGDYIQFVDSDDWIELDMTEKLYSTAIKEKADIVVCDYYRNHNNSYHYKIDNVDTQNNFNNLGFVHYPFIWNKLFCRELLSRVIFTSSLHYEDRVISQQAFFYANKIVKIPCPLYHYCLNPNSISQKKNTDIYLGEQENILFVIDFLRKNLKGNFDLKKKKINARVNKFKLQVFKAKNLPRKKELINFYPESKFWQWYFANLFKRALKALFPYFIYKLYRDKIKNRMD